MLGTKSIAVQRDGVGGCTHTTPSTMGKVSVLPETGFWHFGEFAGSQAWEEEGILATRVREVWCITAVARLGCTVHSSGAGTSSSSTPGSFILLFARGASREEVEDG